MGISRRGFLGAMLGAMAAPAIVRSESLMKIIVPKKEIIIPNAMHFGNMVWKPELVLVLPTARHVKELHVQPSFQNFLLSPLIFSGGRMDIRP